MVNFGEEFGSNYNDEFIIRIFEHHIPMYALYQKELGELLKRQFPTVRQYNLVEGGTGTGLSTRFVLAASDRIHLVGVDNEPLMLEKAQIRFHSEPRVTLVGAGVLEYLRGVPSDSLHGFATSFLLHNMSPGMRQQVVPEIYRVLKRGGVYINADRCGRDNLVEYFVNLAAQIQKLSMCLALGKKDEYVRWFSHLLRDENWRFQEHEQHELLETAGFVDVQLVERFQTECLFTALKP